MRKSRIGKYYKYEKRVLQFLVERNEFVGSGSIKKWLKIPKSSLYDVLGKLRYYGYIEWLGEPQDWLSEIGITEKGRDYLKSFID